MATDDIQLISIGDNNVETNIYPYSKSNLISYKEETAETALNKINTDLLAKETAINILKEEINNSKVTMQGANGTTVTKTNNHYTISSPDAYSKIETNAKLNEKVDKVNGMSLTSNNLTNELKSKLDGLSNYNHPEKHPASIITQDANNRLVTDTERNTWNNKANASHGEHVPTKQIANNNVFLRNDNTWQTIPTSSISQAGIVQLDNTITSTSTTKAATINSVKLINDKAIANTNKIGILENNITSNNTSENLLNADVTQFKVGTGKANNINKDYTNQMQQSLVMLDNIKGSTIKDGNGSLISRTIKSIVASNDKTPYMVDLTKPTKIMDNTTFVVEGSSVKLTSKTSSGSFAQYEITLETNTQYTCLVKARRINGTPHLNIWCKDSAGTRQDISNIVLRDASECVMMDTFTTTDSGYLELNTYCNASDGFASDKSCYYDEIKFIKASNCIRTDIILRSLPDGVCDEIKDNKLINRIGSFHIDGNSDLSVAGDSQGYKQFFIKLPNSKTTVISPNEFEFGGGSSNWVKKGTVEGETYNGECVRIIEGNLYIKTTSAGLTEFKAWLNSVGGLNVIYELDVPTSVSINSTILANSGDTIYIDTPMPLSCTHQVSINTKSQIEETQKIIQIEKKSVWQKIKDLTDVKMYLGNGVGYLKLPTVLGGLILQWGTTRLNFNNEGHKGSNVYYPISFSERVFITQVTPQRNNIDAYSRFLVAGADESLSLIFLEATKLDRLEVTGWVDLNWFVIGK